MKTKTRLLIAAYVLITWLAQKLELLRGFNSSSFNNSSISILLEGKLNPVVVDVGCNVGDFVSEVIAVQPNTKFFCFDINPESGEALKKRFRTVDFNFQNLGLSDDRGKYIYTSNGLLDRKAHLVKKVSKNYKESKKYNRVEVSTLDKTLSKMGVSNIDILKIDTEGMDFKVLKGANNTLISTNIVVFEIMYRLLTDGSTPDDVFQFLRRSGFKHFYRLTTHFGLQPIERIDPWQVATQNIVSSRVNLL